MQADDDGQVEYVADEDFEESDDDIEVCHFSATVFRVFLFVCFLLLV